MMLAIHSEPWPLVLSTSLLMREPLASVLGLIKEVGFGSIEIAASTSHFNYHSRDAISKLRKILDTLDIRVNSFHAPYMHSTDITLLDEGDRRKAVEEILASAKALFTLGGRILVIHGGSEQEYVPVEEVQTRLNQASKSLLEIYETCQGMGLSLALEDMLAHLLGGKIEQLQWLISQLPEKQTGICLDTGHSFLAGRLEAMFRSFGRRILMAHIHDNSGFFDDHLPPGYGRIPWSRLFRSFVESGFKGPLVLELAGAGSVEESIRNAAKGAAFIRQTASEF